VIDNYGDIGVCWRLARQLVQHGQQVCLWVDDPTALSWMTAGASSGVQVQTWTQPLNLADKTPGDVLIEAFGCEIDTQFIARYALQTRIKSQHGLWINLEYLSAEAFVERCHLLPSPVMSGPGAGLSKFFFYPGFTVGTGGLLREPNLLTQQALFDPDAWLTQLGISSSGQRLIPLFCYEPAGLTELLHTLANDAFPSTLLVTDGRASAAVRAEVARQKALAPSWNAAEKLTVVYLPKLSQTDFDRLLWVGDLNFVRGEDSLVRALWAGKPFIWQIYPQDDAAHMVKLQAFLDWLQAPEVVRQLHHWWNQSTSQASKPVKPPPLLSPQVLQQWRDCVKNAQTRLLSQPDLVTQLLDFVGKRH
jgi:uncharacterized repeat protein (TIGR03837 family)